MKSEHFDRLPSSRCMQPSTNGVDPTSAAAAAAAAASSEPLPLPSVTCPSCQSSTCHCFRPGESVGERRRQAKAKLSQVWVDFNRALRSIEPFDTMHWIKVLFVSVTSYLYHISRLSCLAEAFRLDTVWRPLVPAFGIGLVLFVEVVYFTRLREHFVVRAWCKPCAAASSETADAGYGEATCTVDGETTYCLWDIVHACFAVYLGIMIAFHYMCTTFASPGVVLSPILENEQNDGAVKVEEKWSCMDARGGCCFINPTLDVMYERRLVSMYPSVRVDADERSNEQAGNTTNSSETSGEVRYFPSPFRSFCKKCQKERPARAHHCSACNRCVLQMDHHCPWVNNCIGFGNYRYFFLTIFYVTLGTLYGILLLGPPFYGAMKIQFKEHGFKLLLKHKTGLLDLPPPWVLWQQARTTGIEPDVLLRMVVGLFLGAGLAMMLFLAYHVMYVFMGLTTLEHSISLSLMKKELEKNPSDIGRIRRNRPINPFDHGWKRNFAQALGPSFLALVLPIPIEPLAPLAHKRKRD